VPRWTPFGPTEQRLADIMSGIHDRYLATADDYGTRGDYFAGANIAGLPTSPTPCRHSG
jgi:glutamate dehydrogenase (NADP+)